MNKKFPHPYKKLLADFKLMKKKLPRDVSILAVDHFKMNFRRQGAYGETGTFKKWKARLKANTKRSKGRAILVQSARLKRSLRAAPQGVFARVVTDVPYAKVHNEGSKGVVYVKAHKRTASVKRTIKGGYSGVGRRQKSKRVTFNGARHNVKAHSKKQKIPARPFMKMDGVLKRRINALIDREIIKLWKS
jgi:phage gpG-like protein